MFSKFNFDRESKKVRSFFKQWQYSASKKNLGKNSVTTVTNSTTKSTLRNPSSSAPHLNAVPEPNNSVSPPNVITTTKSTNTPGMVLRIIAAIDFGTSFTRAAYIIKKYHLDGDKYVTVNDHSTNSIIDVEWPNAGDTSHKIPSVVAYRLGRISTDFKCGYEARNALLADYDTWIPLDGLEMKLAAGMLCVDENIPGPAGKTANEALHGYDFNDKSKPAADFLSHVWQFTKIQINDYISTLVPDDANCTIKWTVVLTVPSFLSVEGRRRTEQVACKAGLNGANHDGGCILEILDGTEAAAIYALESAMDNPRMKPGEHYIVCDLGGGIFDIAAYHIKSMRAIEIQKSDKFNIGDLQGQDSLDVAFKKFLVKRIGAKRFSSIMEADNHEILNRWWERVKPSINLNSEYYYIRLFPGFRADETNLAMSVIDGELRMTRIDMHTILLKPISTRLTQAVVTQLEYLGLPKNPVPLFIFGELGQNVVLLKELHRLRNRWAIESVETHQLSDDRGVCWGAIRKVLTASYEFENQLLVDRAS